MGMTDKSLCDSCTNTGCEFQSGIVRTKCAFYMPPQLEPDNCGNYVVQDSTTKNDIRDNRVKNELNRVKDELEPTTKNDLGVDCISREDAIKVFSQIIRQDAGVEEYIKNMISPIMKSYINQEYTFIINGDCSKIGWETSERFHEARMKWCEKHKYDPQNIIVINFGEGEEPCYIVFENRAE